MIPPVLRQGNCLDLLPKLRDGAVHLTLTSPPYDHLRDYGGEDEHGWGWETFCAVAAELWRVTAPGGVVVWNVGDAVVDGSETCTSFKQAIHFKEVCGFRLHDTMIWQKSNFSNPASTRYHQVFEYVFVLSKGAPRVFNPIKDRRNVCAGKAGSFGENTVTQQDGGKKTRASKVNTAFGQRHNVWITPTAGQDQTARRWGHPAMFSEAFAADHIKSWSNIGDVVLDPFCGSGTTLIAARNLGRVSVGFEVNAGFTDIARRRIAA